MQNVDKTNKYETTALNRVLAAFTPRVFIESDDVVVSSSTLNKILSIMWIIPLFARILDWMILDCTPFHSSKISIKVTNNKIYLKITSSLRCSYLLYKLIWIVKNYLFYSGCERIIFFVTFSFVIIKYDVDTKNTFGRVFITTNSSNFLDT